jgi:hypothetical protein
MNSENDSSCLEARRTRLFDQRLSRYYTLHASVVLPVESDEQMATLTDALDEAARAVVFTPTGSAWQVLKKIDVLQQELDLGTACTDRRESAFLGAIRADISQLG